jgi:hypothetical protein
VRAAFAWNRHCEERSDEAIQRTCARYVPLDCFASLAMTMLAAPTLPAGGFLPAENLVPLAIEDAERDRVGRPGGDRGGDDRGGNV